MERCLFFQGLLALAYDSVQVLKQALNEQPCSSINGTTVTMNDTAKILACIRKVTSVELDIGTLSYESLILIILFQTFYKYTIN